jgi:hypothetical protein
LPNSGEASAKFEVREVEAIGGQAFELVKDGYTDLLMIRYPQVGRVETVRMTSDFAWTWARFLKDPGESSEGGELLELLVLDGQRLELDGKEILKSAHRVDYLLASRNGDRFQIETSEGRLELNLPIGNLEQLFMRSQISDQKTRIEDLKSEI